MAHRGPILTVVGARPNFMKAAPIHRAFEARGVDHRLIHTGQHYDPRMSKVFFDDLGMPRPSRHLGVGSASHAAQTGALLPALEDVFREVRPDLVLVVGDVNSTLAGALTASKMGIAVAHVEAGLRSRDWSMPEEVNRTVTDALADLLLTPSSDADENLRAEGRNPDRIVRVGNVMIDTLDAHLEEARRRDPWPTLGAERPAKFGLVTLHRPSNVDEAHVLDGIWSALGQLSRQLPLVFPVHPRARARVDALPLLDGAQILRTEPIGYLDFLALTASARLVLTDSGGLQEETTALGVPCLTLRDSTERPITVTEGTNVVVGVDPDRILAEAGRALAAPPPATGRPALWDGQAAPRVADAVLGFLDQDRDRWPR